MKKCACGKTISANKEACATCIEVAMKHHASTAKFDGVLEILNVAAGDTKITFDKDNPQESIRARRIVTDMLRRGYALIVEVERGHEKKYERIQAFDEKRGEYIIADLDTDVARAADEQERKMEELKTVYAADHAADPENVSAVYSAPTPEAVVGVVQGLTEPGSKKRGRPTKRLPMETTRATAVGRSAGG